MNVSPETTETDLAAIMCSRICHDVISPVGAINNGLELLDEGGADEDAMGLIRRGARSAVVRLQFARLAFGASGSAGSSIDTGDAQTVMTDYVAADNAGKKPEKNVALTFIGERAMLQKNSVKLLLNLFLTAHGSILRGGSLSVEIANTQASPQFRIVAEGPMIKLAPAFLQFMESTAGEEVDAHTVQPYYTSLMARQSGMRVATEIAAERLVISAV